MNYTQMRDQRQRNFWDCVQICKILPFPALQGRYSHELYADARSAAEEFSGLRINL